MDWITYKEGGYFWAFFAVQSDGHLSSQLASDTAINDAAEELKRQIDIATRRMKIALQSNRPLFGGRSRRRRR